MMKQFVTVAAFLLLGQAALAATADQKGAVQSDKLGASQQVGARVDEVDPDGAAASAGIKPGDIILAINGKPIATLADINPIVAASGKRPLVVEIDRGGKHMRVKVVPHVTSEMTAQGTVQHKVLGISHTDMVVDPHPPKPQNLMNTMFSDEPEPAQKGPQNLMSIMFPPKAEAQ